MQNGSEDDETAPGGEARERSRSAGPPDWHTTERLAELREYVRRGDYDGDAVLAALARRLLELGEL